MDQIDVLFKIEFIKFKEVFALLLCFFFFCNFFTVSVYLTSSQ